MLVQISRENRIRYTKAHKKTIRKLKPFPGGTWDDSSSTMRNLKSYIRTILLAYQQNRCAYCSQLLNLTSGSEIEHIAPKGGKVYPHHTEFTFTAHNLVLSCHLCNSPTKKGRKETIVQKSINYSDCIFNIVHPYFDDVTNHFELVPNKNSDGIIYKPLTDKARQSVAIFDLNNEAHVTARGEQYIAQLLKTSNFPKYRELLIESIVNHKAEI